MKALQDVPLLSQLPRVELAKLVSDIQTLEIARGETISPTDGEGSYVYLVYGGKIGLLLEVDQTLVTLMVLGVGEILGEVTPQSGPFEDRFIYRALEDSVLFRMEKARFQGILTQHPTLLGQFSQAMVRRSSFVLDELARTKTALLLHAEEVWASLEAANEAVESLSASAVTLSAPLEPAPATQPSAKAKWTLAWSWRSFLHYGFPVLAAFLVATVGGTDLTFSAVRACLGILIWGVLSWLFDSLPDYVVALTIVLVAAVGGIVTPEIAFSGFASRTWFLLLAVLGISAGISRTGLLYRVALHMLKLFPPTYGGQSTALALGGLVLAPFLPGVTGRQAMAARLALELSEAMRFKPRSRESAGLAMACFMGFSCIYYISMTGGSVTLLVWSILPAAAKASLSWSSWFLAALPAALFVFGATLYAILRFFRPTVPVRIASNIVDSQLRVLGPMSRQEWITVWVVLAIVGAFITQPLHGVDPTWVALPGFLFLCSAGIVDKDLLRRGIDWGFLLLTGGLLSVAALTEKSGFVKAVSGAIAPLVQPLADHPWLFLSGIALLTAIIHLAVPFQPTILLTALALSPIAAQLGYNPFVVGLVILIMASHFVIPHGNPMYMAAYGGTEERAFTHRQVWRLSLVHAGITLAAIWVSIPVWSWLGILFQR